DYGCRDRNGRAVELPHTRGAARLAGPKHVLARAPLVSGEHQPHQRSRSLVQELVPDPHGRQKAGRDPSEPRTDQATARAVWAVRSFSAVRLTFSSPESSLPLSSPSSAVKGASSRRLIGFSIPESPASCPASCLHSRCAPPRAHLP